MILTKDDMFRLNKYYERFGRDEKFEKIEKEIFASGNLEIIKSYLTDVKGADIIGFEKEWCKRCEKSKSKQDIAFLVDIVNDSRRDFSDMPEIVNLVGRYGGRELVKKTLDAGGAREAIAAGACAEMRSPLVISELIRVYKVDPTYFVDLVCSKEWISKYYENENGKSVYNAGKYQKVGYLDLLHSMVYSKKLSPDEKTKIMESLANVVTGQDIFDDISGIDDDILTWNGDCMKCSKIVDLAKQSGIDVNDFVKVVIQKCDKTSPLYVRSLRALASSPEADIKLVMDGLMKYQPTEDNLCDAIREYSKFYTEHKNGFNAKSFSRFLYVRVEQAYDEKNEKECQDPYYVTKLKNERIVRALTEFAHIPGADLVLLTAAVACMQDDKAEKLFVDSVPDVDLKLLKERRDEAKKREDEIKDKHLGSFVENILNGFEEEEKSKSKDAERKPDGWSVKKVEEEDADLVLDDLVL